MSARTQNTRKLCLAAGAGVLMSAADAHAHLVTTELGPFYDGTAHAVISLEDLLTVVGFAILASHAGRTAGRRMLVVLILGWALGLCAGMILAPAAWDAPVATAGVILLLGAAGALRVRVATKFLVTGAGVAGVWHGLLNGASVRADGGPWLTVAGIAVGVLVLSTLLTGVCTWVHGRRAAVVLRVAASWTGAIGLLMLGWHIRG